MGKSLLACYAPIVECPPVKRPDGYRYSSHLGTMLKLGQNFFGAGVLFWEHGLLLDPSVWFCLTCSIVLNYFSLFEIFEIGLRSFY